VIRVVVGEDQPVLSEPMSCVLEQSGFEVAATANDAPELLRRICEHRPDVAIADIQMPPSHTDDGLRAVLEARGRQRRLGILLLSKFLERRHALELIVDGAEGVGYIPKENVGQIDTFADAVRRVAGGGTALDPDVQAMLVGRTGNTGAVGELSKREVQVLRLIAQGCSNPGIAQQLSITVGAVEHHVTRIFDKLDLPNKPEHHRRVLAALEYLKQ
jgi:DNA-binding NarL/FixJ family response regulator